MIRSLALAAVVVLGGVLASGCGVTTVQGTAALQPIDLTMVAGLPLSDGPSGLRPGTVPAGVEVDNDSGDEIDVIAKDAIGDLQTFWDERFPAEFHKRFKHLDRIVSWDAADTTGSTAPSFCGFDPTGIANAGYCHDDNEMGWDRGILMSGLDEKFGPLAIVTVLAHEYGHAVQYQTGADVNAMPVIVAEQQADCYAGVFMREVAEGNSEHFTMNTSDGLGNVLSAMVSTRDDPSDDYFSGSEHGSAFERVTAFQLGFGGDAQRCAAIDPDDVDSRRANLPLNVLMAGEAGDLPVTAESLALIVDSLESTFNPADPPLVTYAGVDVGCEQQTEPVTYCPETNSIGVDLPGLVAASTPEKSTRDLPADIVGDFTAFGLLASRYALAVQADQGLPLDGLAAALRSACLTGAWTGTVASNVDGPVRLSPGDLDEAISSLLSNGLMASDVQGQTVLSGFTRVEAFRTGLVSGPDMCAQAYR
ncbi:neutral zinc metallopeptidase [Tomitella biformata]|uniref:neutral zinc metallopeptidase n=1 Tax=Tomitella biformata TaxID=630403 RepID=UPI00046330B6|nr:neutral zinc metallopeptidase [Tomitella biformata]